MTDAAEAAPPAPTATAADFAEALNDTIKALARRFNPDGHDPDRITSGQLAELRRMDCRWPTLPPAFWATWFKLGLDQRYGGETAERAWAVILQGMALLAPNPDHRWNKKERMEHAVGAVLARTGYSEQRFVRLLRAEDEALTGEVGTVCRWLAAKGQAVDWVEFAGFILARLTRPDSKDAESKGHALARAYFRALTKSDAKTETAPSAQESAR